MFTKQTESETDLIRVLAFVGMSVVDIDINAYPYEVKISRHGGGLVSRGGGNTRRDAIESAMFGQNIDFDRVREKMFDEDVDSIMHK